MRIEGHIEKIENLERTLSKLDNSEDHETIVELCILISAHYINAAIHSIGRLRPDKDLKHNRIPGIIKREEYFDSHSNEIADLLKELEDMRPSHIYGTGKNGSTALRAREILSAIKSYCEGLIYV
jgi:hypothetical protein